MALRALNKLVRARGVRCIVQDHGGGVPAFGVKRRLYRKALTSIQQAAFGDSQARDQWIRRGFLFPPGDAVTLQKILCRLPQIVESAERARVIRRFEKEFSYPAIAQKFLALYHG